MAHRAAKYGYQCAVYLATTLRNIQRKNSLDSGQHQGESRDAHIDRLRPLYDSRLKDIHYRADRYRVNERGEQII